MTLDTNWEKLGKAALIGCKKARNMIPKYFKLSQYTNTNANMTALSPILNMNDEVFSGFTFVAN